MASLRILETFRCSESSDLRFKMTFTKSLISRFGWKTNSGIWPEFRSPRLLLFRLMETRNWLYFTNGFTLIFFAFSKYKPCMLVVSSRVPFDSYLLVDLLNTEVFVSENKLYSDFGSKYLLIISPQFNYLSRGSASVDVLPYLFDRNWTCFGGRMLPLKCVFWSVFCENSFLAFMRFFSSN